MRLEPLSIHRSVSKKILYRYIYVTCITRSYICLIIIIIINLSIASKVFFCVRVFLILFFCALCFSFLRDTNIHQRIVLFPQEKNPTKPREKYNYRRELYTRHEKYHTLHIYTTSKINTLDNDSYKTLHIIANFLETPSLCLSVSSQNTCTHRHFSNAQITRVPSPLVHFLLTAFIKRMLHNYRIGTINKNTKTLLSGNNTTVYIYTKRCRRISLEIILYQSISFSLHYTTH